MSQVPFIVRSGIAFASTNDVHATFMQKVIICMVAGFLAAALIEWGKTFITGADEALNGGYKHRTEDPGAHH